MSPSVSTCLQCFADLTDFGVESCGLHLGDSLTLHDQRAGVNKRQIIATGTAHVQIADLRPFF